MTRFGDENSVRFRQPQESECDMSIPYNLIFIVNQTFEYNWNSRSDCLFSIAVRIWSKCVNHRYLCSTVVS